MIQPIFQLFLVRLYYTIYKMIRMLPLKKGNICAGSFNLYDGRLQDKNNMFPYLRILAEANHRQKINHLKKTEN